MKKNNSCLLDMIHWGWIHFKKKYSLCCLLHLKCVCISDTFSWKFVWKVSKYNRTYIIMLSVRGHKWRTYCYRIIFAGAEVLLVHIRHLTLDLHAAVDACTVVRGYLHDLRCSGYSPIKMLYEFWDQW